MVVPGIRSLPVQGQAVAAHRRGGRVHSQSVDGSMTNGAPGNSRYRGAGQAGRGAGNPAQRYMPVFEHPKTLVRSEERL